MKKIALVAAGFLVLGAGAAAAQPGWGRDRGYWVPDRGPAFEGERPWPGPMRPRRMARLLSSLGLDPIGPPVRQGGFLLQPAADDDGRAVRVTINLETGQVVSVTPEMRVSAAPPMPRPYPNGAYADDDADFAPPGSMMRPRADLPPEAYPPRAVPPGYAPRGQMPPSVDVSPYPPRVIEAPKPHRAKSANATPKTPVPRKRPEAGQNAKNAEPGSVAPISPTPVAPPAQGATPAPAPGALPPVAPLE